MSDRLQIEAATAFERHERKFPLDAKLWSRVVERARRILPVERFDGAHELVSIRTVYLDTPGLDSYREYLEESPIRRKIRIRQYRYDGERNGNCWLEIKLRHYEYSLKYRFRSDADQLAALLNGEDIAAHVAQLNSDNPGALRTYQVARDLISQRELRPIVRVDYQRVAFQEPRRPDVRLTLDRHIRFDATRRPMVRYPGAVMEAKFRDEEPAWLDELMNDLSIEDWSRFSKYARAVADLGLNGHS